MIRAENISKFFGNVQALKGVSFEVQKGEIVGFLGKNAAGKTTLMRILTGYMPPTEGKVFIDGKDVARASLALRRNIGYLPETPPLYANMTVRDYLKFAARLKDVPVREQRARIDKVLDDCRLLYVQNKLITQLSKGYKQRIGVAQTIIHDPEILILDEPTSGLDPVQIDQVRKLIKNIEHKRTVLLSTHILPEIEQIARRVLIINRGEIIKDQSMEDLLSEESPVQRVRVRFKGDSDAIGKVVAAHAVLKEVHMPSSDGVHAVDLEVDAATMPREWLRAMIEVGAQVLEVKEYKPRLQDIFLKLNPPQPGRTDE